MSDKENARRIEHRRRQYRQYNLIVEQGTLLEAILERYKELNPVVSKGKSPRDRRGGLSELIRDCLCERFGITDYEPYSEYKVNRVTGERLPGHDLDSYLKAAEERQCAFKEPIQNAPSPSNRQAAITAREKE